jgi:alkylation response protein AidB-like acyl-CoA dehydrogenase
MDLTHNDEQNALREAVAGLLGRAYGGEQRRTVVASEPGFDEKTWSRLAEMGVLGLPFAEEVGGMGAGPIEVALVAEEIGRVLAPEPFVEAVLAGALIDAVGTAAQRTDHLPAIAGGSVIPVFAHAEPTSRWSTDAAAVHATERDGSWLLTGVKEPVPHGARADLLVVSASIDDTTGLFLVPGDAEGLTPTGYRTHDGGRAARVEFANTPADLLGAGPADRTTPIAAALAGARIAYAHEALGAMSAALAMTTDYLRTRKQFGVTLSKFQDLSFRAADMYVALELARSTALWAALVADGGGDVETAAEHARLQSSRASRQIGEEAVQLHGGIGMTAEYRVGHYAARLVAIDHLLGDGDWALSRLAADVDRHDLVDPLGPPYA